MAPVSTLRPWKNGSNMDINELQEGSTIFIPVFLKGGLDLDGGLALPPGQRRGEPHRARVLLQGDRHAAHRAQGHEARTGRSSRPGPTGSRSGSNEDLNMAMVNAVREAVDWLPNQKTVPMSRYEAYWPRLDGRRLPGLARSWTSARACTA